MTATGIVIGNGLTYNTVTQDLVYMMQKSRCRDMMACMSAPDATSLFILSQNRKKSEMRVPKYMEDGVEDDYEV